VPHISGAQIKGYKFDLPPLPEQRSIARVLGGLDDKIELNRRMNRTLEDLARGVFRSWFVDFDPVLRRAGAAGTARGATPHTPHTPPPLLWPARLVDPPAGSALGPIPEGWRMSKVGEHTVNFDSKRVPVAGGERAKRQGKYPYYGAASVMDYVDDYLFDGIYLLVGEDGSVIQPSGLAVTQYVWGKIWVNNHAHVLQGKGAVCTEHLWAYFQHEDVGGIVTGAVQPKITQGNMNNLPFLYPGEDVCREFARVVAPWFARIRANTDETRELAALRDALLPQLLSGEIRLREAERAVGESLQSAGTPRRGDGITHPRTGKAAGSTKGRA
jgi:type I restriction enzyme S subunit